MKIGSRPSTHADSTQSLRQFAWLIGIVLVVGLVGFLRFNYLETNPGWYSDEGSDMDIARHLGQGQWQYFALGGTPLVAGRFPLFHILLVFSFQVWGYDIVAARLLVAFVNVATVAILLIAVREMLGKPTALLSILMLGIMPNSFLYARIAFAYNVQALFFVICWYTLWKFYRSCKSIWLFCAVAAASAAYMVALTGLPLVACVLLIALWKRPSRVIWALPLMLTPGLIFLAALYLGSPVELQQDLALTYGRTSESLAAQVFNLISNYVLWFDWTFWVALGLIGLFLLPSRSLRWLTLFVFLGVLFNVMRAFPGAGDLNLHRYLGVMPFLAVGAAQFLLSAISFLYDQLKSDLEHLRLPARLELLKTKSLPDFIAYSAIAIFIGLPLLWLTLWDTYLVSAPLIPRPTRLDFVSATAPSDAREVTDWVNTRTGPDDVVLASSTIAWLLRSHIADFQQALAYEGVVTDNYGAGLPRTRFLYDVSFENAKFVIVDGLWRGWAAERMPKLRDYLKTIESWELVKSRGEFDVYRNPAR